MPRASLPPMNRSERRAAAEASRKRDDGRPLMTIPEAADYLGVARDSVYRFIRRGDLRSIMVGNVLRIRPSDLDAFLENNIVS